MVYNEEQSRRRTHSGAGSAQPGRRGRPATPANCGRDTTGSPLRNGPSWVSRNRPNRARTRCPPHLDPASPDFDGQRPRHLHPSMLSDQAQPRMDEQRAVVAQAEAIVSGAACSPEIEPEAG